MAEQLGLLVAIQVGTFLADGAEGFQLCKVNFRTSAQDAQGSQAQHQNSHENFHDWTLPEAGALEMAVVDQTMLIIDFLTLLGWCPPGQVPDPTFLAGLDDFACIILLTARGWLY
jgi:hypothetical protein